MSQSMVQKLLKIRDALSLLGGGTAHDLNWKTILFQRGNVGMDERKITSDVLKRRMKELYEEWYAITKKKENRGEEITAFLQQLIDELLKDDGHVFVLFHEGRYYKINMSIDEVRACIRSEKVGQMFRDRKAKEKKYISTFVALEKLLQRAVVYVDNLAVDEKTKKIYENFLKIVRMTNKQKKEEKIHKFHETHKQKPSVFDTLLKICTDNGFVNLPTKIRDANPMQANSNASGEPVNNERIETDIVDGSEPPPQPISSITVGEKRNCSDSHDQRPNNISGKRVRIESTTCTLLNSLSQSQIELHIKSLTEVPTEVLKKKCREILTLLMNQDKHRVFNKPVDPVALGIPDYFEKIKQPMDLGTIKKRLDSSSYKEVHDFDTDVHLTFANAMVYNEPGTLVHEMAKQFLELYNSEFQKMTDKLKEEEEERRKNDNACTLCGYEKLQFQHPVIFCSGTACQSQHIPRNRVYYTDGVQCNWCTSCYNKLDDNQIHLQDKTLYKEDLIEKKNDEINEENWVKCDECHGWMHQICGLFNPRQNKNDDSVKFSCPACLLKKKERQPDTWYPRAEDLPRTKSSEFLENHVTKKLQKKYEELASVKAKKENIHFDEAIKKVQTGGKITIRQVSAIEKKLEVMDRMRNRYKHMDYPEEFTYRSKCFLVFQNLDGIDVVLFGLYVYEHDERNPAPNTRTVYISYLDSVNYMAPRHLRTFVYHEILISYLDYARQHGYATAHIWACPPSKGDDYIFHAKPKDQKTLKKSRLRQWYVDMLIEAQKRYIVGTVTNMHDLYFMKGNDATIVPYFEGDYIPGQIESFIKEVEDGKSNGKCHDPKPFDKSNDEAMKKLEKKVVEVGKDSFIVAHLNWNGAKPEDMKVPKYIEEERERRKKEELTDGSNRVEKEGHGKAIGIIDDDSEDLESDILDSRQDFLNLCMKNNYQFDQLRRAKHTSMMLLCHLRNQNAAKKCDACGKDIVAGIGYSNETCTCFYLCDESNENSSTNRGACTHKPKSMDEANTGETEAQRAKTWKLIHTYYIPLLEHARKCNSGECKSSHCAKMKQCWEHYTSCGGHNRGCKDCNRIFFLLSFSTKSKVCSKV